MATFGKQGMAGVMTDYAADNVYEGAMDAFVVEGGKIVAHFFSGKITPKAALPR